MALLIILIMLILGVILAIYYLPHPQKPFRVNKNYTFETAEELSPNELTTDLHHFSPAELSKAEIDYTLPDNYDEDQICLMVRDPE